MTKRLERITKVQNSFSDERVYEQTLKPLIRDEKYGLASDLMNHNPRLQQYMSRQELGNMMGYYRRVLYALTGGLELLTKRMEAMR